MLKSSLADADAGERIDVGAGAGGESLLKSRVVDADAGERIDVGAGAGGEEGAEEDANAGADTANGDGTASCCSEDLPELLGEASFVPLFD